MSQQDPIQQLLATENISIDLPGFIINLLLSAVLAVILSHVYTNYGNSLSNRKMFARNFLLIAMATTIIITVVKSSLALSLGLVGALSIVRFRSAIKEPEELSYLFLLIGMGLGMGANQRALTMVAFVVTVAVIIVHHKLTKREVENNMFLSVSLPDSTEKALDGVINTLKEHCDRVRLKRLDEHDSLVEGTFIVEFKDFEQLHNSRQAILDQHKNASITWMDNRGIN